MSDEKTIPQPSRIPRYWCGVCGIFHNNYNYECPLCALKAEFMAKLDLIMAVNDLKDVPTEKKKAEKKPAK
jgi:hypothetical protein